jgi:hypothetical protein
MDERDCCGVAASVVASTLTLGGRGGDGKGTPRLGYETELRHLHRHFESSMFLFR